MIYYSRGLIFVSGSSEEAVKEEISRLLQNDVDNLEVAMTVRFVGNDDCVNSFYFVDYTTRKRGKWDKNLLINVPPEMQKKFFCRRRSVN